MSSPASRGYSLIELLVVLFIIGILAMVGVNQFGSRQRPAVLSMASAIEGELTRAFLMANSNMQPVRLTTNGTWASRSLSLTYGLARDFTAIPPTTTTFSAGNQSDFQYAGIDSNNAWFPTATSGAPLDTGSTALNAVVTNPANDLFTGALSNAVFVDGNAKRFSQDFHITIVGLRAGDTYQGAPTVVIVGNGQNLFKFYKPEGQTTWRRL